MPPPKVEIIKPAVIDMMPALVRSVCGETPMMPRIPKFIAKTTSAKKPNWRIVAAWTPICGVNKGLIRRNRRIAVNPKKSEDYSY